MKRIIMVLLCGLVSAGILGAQTESPQPPAPSSTTPKTTATTHKKTSTTAKPGASTATTGKTTSTAQPKTSTSKTAAGKATAPTTAKTGTTPAATHRTTPAAGSHATTAAKAPSTTWITTGTGLKYQDVLVGKGPQPKPGDDILVNYTGRFLDGKVFDSSLSPGRTPFELHLGRGEVIPGWDEGLATMHVGGKRKLLIPPNLAYGAAGAGGVIPPNATLTFDVELLKIK